LLDIKGAEFLFCPGSYFDFLRTGEYLGWELAQNYHPEADNGGDSYKEIVLPFRDNCEVIDFRSRCTAFGTCTLVITRNQDGKHKFLLNKRSESLGETPGLLHVIPAGTFQPAFSNGEYSKKYLSFTENIFREFVEEIVDDEFLRGNTEKGLDIDDLLAKKARDFFKTVKEKGRYNLCHLGTVIDPVNLKPEILTVMIIDECYMELEKWTPSWETDENLYLKDFCKEEIETVLNGPKLVPTCRAHLFLVHRNFDFLMEKLNGCAI
jgi:hypothetical protein